MKKTCLFVLAGIAFAGSLADAQSFKEGKAPACKTPKHAGVPQLTAEGSFFVGNSYHALWPLHLITLVPSNFYTGADQTVKTLGDKIVVSQWIHTALKDYVSVEKKATHAMFKTAEFTDKAPLYSDVMNYIEVEIAKNPKIAHTGHNLYMVFLPAHIQAVPKAGDHADPGFHQAFTGIANAKGDGWASIQPGGKSFDRERTSIIMSHELAEAVTDTGGTGWKIRYSDKTTKQLVANESPWIAARNEVGDLCAEARILDPDGEVYERTFSNSAAAAGGDPCVPAASSPYFNTTPAFTPLSGFQAWTLAHNGEAEIKLVGWISGTSTECELKWNIKAKAIDGQNPHQFKPGLPTPLDENIANNGTGTLKVTVPASTPPGSWGVVQIISTPLVAPDAKKGIDASHSFYFGVYTE